MAFARLLAVTLLTLSTIAYAADPVSAAVSVPTCKGKRATQWLTEPGQLYGTSGDDVLVGTSGNDSIYGHIFAPSGGVDLICAGRGDDYITITGWGSRAYTGSGNDILNIYEGAVGYGESGNDNLFGQGFYCGVTSVTVDGGSGDDTASAFIGTAINTGSGNDSVEVDLCAGPVSTGSGNDTVTFSGRESANTERLDCGAGKDTYDPRVSSTIRRCETPIT